MRLPIESHVDETSLDMVGLQSEIQDSCSRQEQIALITDKKTLLDFLRQEMLNHSTTISNLESSFEKYPCRVSEIMLLSHMFCQDCRMETIDAPIDVWCEKNPEYAETDVFYLHYLFLNYPMIEQDVEALDLVESGVDGVDLKRKIFTIITHYEFYGANDI